MPGHEKDLGPNFLRPFKALVHLQHQYRQNLQIDQPAILIISEGDWLCTIKQITQLDIYFKLKALKILKESATIIYLNGVTPKTSVVQWELESAQDNNIRTWEDH